MNCGSKRGPVVERRLNIPELRVESLRAEKSFLDGFFPLTNFICLRYSEYIHNRVATNINTAQLKAVAAEIPTRGAKNEVRRNRV